MRRRGVLAAPRLPSLAVLVLAAVLISDAGHSQAQGRFETFERDSLTIETAGGARHVFQVELAVTPGQQAQGLMHRRRLAADAGMLFIYRAERPISMWMKNTLIPLDMLFLARDGRILRIVERTVPLSLETIESKRAAKGVLEVNAGTAARLGIAVGDRVRHPAFGGGS